MGAFQKRKNMKNLADIMQRGDNFQPRPGFLNAFNLCWRRPIGNCFDKDFFVICGQDFIRNLGGAHDYIYSELSLNPFENNFCMQAPQKTTEITSSKGFLC